MYKIKRFLFKHESTIDVIMIAVGTIGILHLTVGN